MQAQYIIDIITYVAIVCAIILFILVILKSNRNKNYPKKRENKRYNYAVLIPARYESNVIEDLLISLEEQTYKIDSKNVYVIVESKEDPTIDICKKHNMNFFVRKKLEYATKGYALDECVKEILKDNKKYDAYYIFDADNILDKYYFEKMNETFIKGYDIGMGYRNTKNGNDNVVAAASSLIFSMVNSLSNKRKNRQTRTITLSGTGFYISGKYVEKWTGYPFNSLTEDYELTLYSTVNGLTSYYNEDAIFFDEQPTKFKTTINQRTRWIKGFFGCRKKYLKELINVAKKKKKNSSSAIITSLFIIPILIMVITITLNIIIKFISFIITIGINNINIRYELILEQLITIISLTYLILFIITAVILSNEKDKINLNKFMKFKVLLYNPIYLITFVWCAIKAVTLKNITWEKVEHNRNIKRG